MHTPLSHRNVLQHDIVMATCTFVIVECNVHCVSAYTDGSEASFGVGMVIRTIEILEGTFGYVILYGVCVCVYHNCYTGEIMLLHPSYIPVAIRNFAVMT